MVIQIPKRHTFPESLTKKILDETGCSLQEWEISVPWKDDIAWSIALSFLMTTNFKDRQDFHRRLNLLTGNNVNKNSVKKSIENFNPFRNRYSCFYDEALKTVIDDLKTHLNWSSLLRVNDKLSAVSEALDCPIVIIRKGEELQHDQVFKRKRKRPRDLITLIEGKIPFEDSKNEKTPVTVFNFLIGSQTGLKMRKAALVYYLKEAKLSKEQIKHLNSIDDNTNSFLIALLKSSHRHVVMELYQSPYVISKLSDATYEMDPRKKDSKGLSALYYALVKNHPDTNILYKLYYFAANNCCKNEGSYRNPDSNIVSNLCYMEELLSSDMSNLENIKNHPKYQDHKVDFAQLIQLNNFLIEVCSKILKVKSTLNYYESTKEHIFEAGKRRDVIVVLLETYNKFFRFPEHHIATQTLLDDYFTYRNYYNSVDMATATLFFDNIVFLKEKLSLENENKFSEIETSFFDSIMHHKYFEQTDILKLIISWMSELLEMDFDLKPLYVFLLIRRTNRLKKINDFSKMLHDTVINENNVVKKIPENVICSTMYPYHDLKDCIELLRLIKYIKIGVNVKLTDAKSVFVIERALQVMGESMPPNEKEDFSFKRFLALCLPKEISQILRRLRHQLSHLKGHEFPFKYECEKNLSLFRSIQKEIIQIEEHFKLFYYVSVFRMIIFVVKHIGPEITNVTDSLRIYTNSCLEPLYYQLFLIKLIEKLPSFIWSLCRPAFRSFLGLALQNIENEIKDECSSSDTRSHENIKNRIVYILWPLKWLLELLEKFGMINIISILDTYESLKRSHDTSELKEITDLFMKQCTNLLPKIGAEKKSMKVEPLKSVKSIAYLVKNLKGFVFLSDEEKEEIRNEIPPNLKKSVVVKEELIRAIEKGFVLDIEKTPSKFELTYLSATKNKEFRKLYLRKDRSAIDVLKDPIEELEKIFSVNTVNKKTFDMLCEKMQFSDKTKNKLGKLVAGQKKKVPGNNLSHLLNRIKLLKKILIEENEEVSNLWNKIKSQKSHELIDIKILNFYLKDGQLRAASEMLLFDCMILFESVKGTENPWLKSSKLYSGINLRNVISHGSPLLENLCDLLDPEELPLEFIEKIILLIQGEDSIEAILQLFEQVNEDSIKCHEIINCEVDDAYHDLRNRIVTCSEWKRYALLLPYKNIRETL